MKRAASAGLNYYSIASSSGAAASGSHDDNRQEALSAMHSASVVMNDVNEHGGFDLCIPDAEPGRSAAKMSYALLLMLLRGRNWARVLLTSGQPLGANSPPLIGGDVPWSKLLHSGWPVFRLAAVVEIEGRSPVTELLARSRLTMTSDPSEGCSEEMEALRHVAVLYAGEGRTVRILDVQEILLALYGREPGQEAKLLLDILYGEPDATQVGNCHAAYSVAFAALADALQCHWHRSHSRQTHSLLASLVDLVEVYAARSFRGVLAEERAGFVWGQNPLPGATATAALFSSRWPILSYLARLEPPAWHNNSVAHEVDEFTRPMVVSWSTREQELGGNNWAETFTHHIFGDAPAVELARDLECADVFVFRSKVPVNFGGVLIFVDGEKGPEDGDLEELLTQYPASIVVGPRPAGGFSTFVPLPYASSSFAGRSQHTPLDLLQRRQQREASEARGFAAYLAYKCWPHRERFFHLLKQATEEHSLGAVTALSRCGSSEATESGRREMRYSRNYMDDAVELLSRFRFAMVFENHISQRYVTEKIVNAFLAGAVPIYWGTPYVFRLFNPKAFIYVNRFSSFEAAIEHIVLIAKDFHAYQAYLEAPILRNGTDALKHFSWHRSVQMQGFTGLRDELFAAAQDMHLKGMSGVMSAVERRPWSYASLFQGQF